MAGLLAVLALAAGAGGAGSAGVVVQITAAGDMAMAPAPDDGASFFAGVRKDLTGDVVFGNLEGTLASGGQSKCGPTSTDCFSFRAPPSYAYVLERAGFNLLNLANNHALDYGPQGQSETVAALDRAGLRHTGRPGEIAYVHARGLTVAVIGFAPYPWAQSLLDIPAAERLVRHAVEASDLVVVTMHAGAEGSTHAHVRPGTETFLGENRGNPIAFAHAMIDAGASLVVGSGPHVLRGLEWYHRRLIAYSVGNFLGNGTLSINGPGGVTGVLKVSLRADGSWASGVLRPVRLVPPGIPIDDKSGAAVAIVRTLSRADFGRRAVGISRVGVLTPPK